MSREPSADNADGRQQTEAGRLARLSVWNRLFHGIPVGLADIEAAIHGGDPTWPEDQAAYVWLRACVVVSNTAYPAVRFALRPAILYWFSNARDEREGPHQPAVVRRWNFHLGEAIGTRMTWDEAVAAVHRKPVDYSGYVSVVGTVEREYRKEWEALFPGTRPPSVEPLFNPDRKTKFQRPWTS